MSDPIHDIAAVQIHANAHSGTHDSPSNVDEHTVALHAHTCTWCESYEADRVAHSYELNSRIGMYLNSRVPINRLPPEILTKVFMAFIRLDQTYFRNDGVQWLRLVNVCRHWRFLIIGTPMFWRFLLFVNAELTSAMLMLSQQSLLTVKVQSDDSPDAVELALCHLFRIQMLHIARRDTSSFERFLAAMNRPAPLLESLHLQYDTLRLVSSGMTLSLALFGAVTPRLQHISIHQFDVPWDLPLLSGLTHLEICGSNIKPSPTTFCHVLSRCPALCTLILSDTLPVASEQRSGSWHVVSLPQLSKLELSGDVLDCVLAVRSISFLPTTHVRISSNITPPAGLLTVLPRLLSHLTAQRGGGFSISSLTVEMSSFRCYLKAYNICEADHQPGFKEPLLDLSLQDSTSSSLLPVICHALPLTQLRELSITLVDRDLPGVQPNSWLTILGSCEKLQCLWVRMWNVDGLLSALKPIPGKEAGHSGRRTMLLPHLQQLSLEGASFGNKQVIDDLRMLLMRRWEDQNAMKWLELIYCDDPHWYMRKVNELKQYVVGGVQLYEM